MALLERKDKELNALRKVLREEVKSHDDEIHELRNLTRDKIGAMKIEIEKLHEELMESEAITEAGGQHVVHERQEIVIDNLKMAKELNYLRKQLDESNSNLNLTTKKLSDEKKMNEKVTQRLETYVNKV
jgi:hypothetical protein